MYFRTWIFFLLNIAITGISLAQDVTKKFQPDFASLEKSNPEPVQKFYGG